VSIDFPSGLIVGLLLLALFFFGCVGGHLYKLHRDGDERALKVLGARPILQYFLLSGLIALFVIIMWMAVVGGVKSRSEAEDHRRRR
jgi:hypothetical protein